jgi:hypothetical protein
MKKQTAVEWLEQQIGSKIADANIKISAYKFYELINQSKEMEKQQIIDAITIGFDEGCSYMHNGTTKFETGLQYYNETYNNETTNNH